MRSAMIGGRPSPRQLGVVVDPYAQAQTDVQTKMMPQIAQGNTYLAGGGTGTLGTTSPAAAAIKQYVAAGFFGATTIGPEIDLAGAPNVTQGYTQAAWVLNGQLSAIGSQTVIGVSDAQNAQSIANQMVDFYNIAIVEGRNAQGVPSSGGAPGPPTSPTTVGGPGGVVPTNLVIGTVVVGALAGVGYGLWRIHRSAA